MILPRGGADSQTKAAAGYTMVQPPSTCST